jgi:hypothetical protein
MLPHNDPRRLRDQIGTVFLQLYRSGIIETANTHLISFAEQYRKDKVIPGLPFEVRMFRAARNYLSVLNALETDFPLQIMLTLIDVRGSIMKRHDNLGF